VLAVLVTTLLVLAGAARASVKEDVLVVRPPRGPAACFDLQRAEPIDCRVRRKRPRAGVERTPTASEARLMRKTLGKKAKRVGDSTVSPSGKLLVAFEQGERDQLVWVLSLPDGRLLAELMQEEHMGEPEFVGEGRAFVVESGCVCEGEDARVADVVTPAGVLHLPYGRYTLLHHERLRVGFQYEREYIWVQNLHAIRTFSYEPPAPVLTLERAKKPRNVQIRAADRLYYTTIADGELQLHQLTPAGDAVVHRRPAEGVLALYATESGRQAAVVGRDGAVIFVELERPAAAPALTPVPGQRGAPPR